MKQRKTVEDYLKTIYLLSKKREVHGAYIAEALGVSKPTVSIALKSLEKEGYLTRDERRAVRLTETGLEIAEATYERHQTFQALLEDLSMETILAEDPDYIFVTTMGDSQKAIDALKAGIESNPAWGSLSAVQNGRYLILPKDLFHYKPNARWGESYEALLHILYPDAQ